MAQVVDSVVLEILTKQSEQNRRAFASLNQQFQNLEKRVGAFNSQVGGMNKLGSSLDMIGSKIGTIAKGFISISALSAVSSTADKILDTFDKSKDFAGFSLREYQGLEHFFKRNNVNADRYLSQIYRYLRLTRQYGVSTKQALLNLSDTFANMDDKTKTAYANQYRLSKSFIDFISSHSEELKQSLSRDEGWFFSEKDVDLANRFKTSITDVKTSAWELLKPTTMGGLRIMASAMETLTEILQRTNFVIEELKNKINVKWPGLGDKLDKIKELVGATSKFAAPIAIGSAVGSGIGWMVGGPAGAAAGAKAGAWTGAAWMALDHWIRNGIIPKLRDFSTSASEEARKIIPRPRAIQAPDIPANEELSLGDPTPETIRERQRIIEEFQRRNDEYNKTVNNNITVNIDNRGGDIASLTDRLEDVLKIYAPVSTVA